MSPGPVIAVEGLKVWFRAGGEVLKVVDGIDLTVGRGRTLCLVGESGCGKSVTALALMGLLAVPPALIPEGRVLFGGADLLQLGQAALAELRGNRISMVFQEPMSSLNPVLTIGRQLTEVIERHQRIGARAAEARALEILTLVRVPEPRRRLRQYAHELSGGMRQRVMIAMALANAPELLIADEPTTALDVTIQAQILRLVRDLQRETGTAMILITHDLGVVAEVADDVAVMYAGHIVERAPVRALFEDPQHPYTLGLMSSVPRLGTRQGRLATIPGTVPSPHQFPAGCRFSTRCPFVVARCRDEAPKLVAIGAVGHEAACWRAPLEGAVTLGAAA